MSIPHYHDGGPMPHLLDSRIFHREHSRSTIDLQDDWMLSDTKWIDERTRFITLQVFVRNIIGSPIEINEFDLKQLKTTIFYGTILPSNRKRKSVRVNLDKGTMKLSGSMEIDLKTINVQWFDIPKKISSHSKVNRPIFQKSVGFTVAIPSRSEGAQERDLCLGIVTSLNKAQHKLCIEFEAMNEAKNVIEIEYDSSELAWIYRPIEFDCYQSELLAQALEIPCLGTKTGALPSRSTASIPGRRDKDSIPMSQYVRSRNSRPSIKKCVGYRVKVRSIHYATGQCIFEIGTVHAVNTKKLTVFIKFDSLDEQNTDSISFEEISYTSEDISWMLDGSMGCISPPSLDSAVGYGVIISIPQERRKNFFASKESQESTADTDSINGLVHSVNLDKQTVNVRAAMEVDYIPAGHLLEIPYASADLLWTTSPEYSTLPSLVAVPSVYKAIGYIVELLIFSSAGFGEIVGGRVAGVNEMTGLIYVYCEDDQLREVQHDSPHVAWIAKTLRQVEKQCVVKLSMELTLGCIVKIGSIDHNPILAAVIGYNSVNRSILIKYTQDGSEKIQEFDFDDLEVQLVHSVDALSRSSVTRPLRLGACLGYTVEVESLESLESLCGVTGDDEEIEYRMGVISAIHPESNSVSVRHQARPGEEPVVQQLPYDSKHICWMAEPLKSIARSCVLRPPIEKAVGYGVEVKSSLIDSEEGDFFSGFVKSVNRQRKTIWVRFHSMAGPNEDIEEFDFDCDDIAWMSEPVTALSRSLIERPVISRAAGCTVEVQDTSMEGDFFIGIVESVNEMRNTVSIRFEGAENGGTDVEVLPYDSENIAWMTAAIPIISTSAASRPPIDEARGYTVEVRSAEPDAEQGDRFVGVVQSVDVTNMTMVVRYSPPEVQSPRDVETLAWDSEDVGWMAPPEKALMLSRVRRPSVKKCVGYAVEVQSWLLDAQDGELFAGIVQAAFPHSGRIRVRFSPAHEPPPWDLESMAWDSENIAWMAEPQQIFAKSLVMRPPLTKAFGYKVEALFRGKGKGGDVYSEYLPGVVHSVLRASGSVRIYFPPLQSQSQSPRERESGSRDVSPRGSNAISAIGSISPRFALAAGVEEGGRLETLAWDSEDVAWMAPPEKALIHRSKVPRPAIEQCIGYSVDVQSTLDDAKFGDCSAGEICSFDAKKNVIRVRFVGADSASAGQTSVEPVLVEYAHDSDEIAWVSEPKVTDPKGSDYKGADPRELDMKGKDNKRPDSKGADSKDTHSDVTDAKLAEAKEVTAKPMEAKGAEAKRAGAKEAEAKEAKPKLEVVNGADAKGAET